MIENLQRDAISLSRGIHRTPSLGEPGELSECVGLIPRAGELVNIPEPVAEDGAPFIAGELLHIHDMAEYKVYIERQSSVLAAHAVEKDTGALVASKVKIDSLPEEVKNTVRVASVGNVLVAHSAGMETRYYLWKDGAYTRQEVGEMRLDLDIGIDTKWEESVTEGVRLNERESTTGDVEEIASVDNTQSAARVWTLEGVVMQQGGEYLLYLEWSAAYSETRVQIEFHKDGAWTGQRITLGSSYGRQSFIAPCDADKITLGFFAGEVLVSRSGYAHLYRVVPGTGEATSYDFQNFNAVMGGVNAYLADKEERDKFVNPFFLRYGVRLATGDVVGLSAPVLVEPNAYGAPLCAFSDFKRAEGAEASGLKMYDARMTAGAFTGDLRYRVRESSQLARLQGSPDVVKSLVFGISRPVLFHRQEADKNSSHVQRTQPFVCESRSCKGLQTRDVGAEWYLRIQDEEDPMEKRIVGDGVFHVVCEIPISNVLEPNETGEWGNVELRKGTLSGLAGITDDALTLPDKRQDITSYKAGVAFAYNNVLILSDLEQSYNTGWPYPDMSGYVPGESVHTNYEGIIDTPNGEEPFVSGPSISQNKNTGWFFFPSYNLKSVTLYRDGEKAEIPLRTHPTLNGKYYYGSIPWVSDEEQGWQKERRSFTTREPNKYITSSPSNPLVPDDTTGRVGGGRILAAATYAKPVSTGQFGQYPIVLFCTDGVWAMSVDSDGTLQSVAPLSRDVLSNPKSVTQTDQGIAFVTRQGLKLLGGGDEARLVSLPVHGLNPDEALFTELADFRAETDNFVSQVQEAQLVYDNANQLLHVFMPAKGGNQPHYVLDLASGEWSRQQLRRVLGSQVPGYPFTTLVISGVLYHYEAEFNTGVREGFLLTRSYPMGDPHARKTLRDLRTTGQRTTGDTKFSVAVYISSDNVHWARLSSLRTKSAKFYRFLIRTRMTDQDTLSGLSLLYTTKWTTKLR